MDLKKPNINILNEDLVFLDRIDYYTSLWFKRHWRECSTFEFHLSEWVPGLALGQRIMLDADGERSGIIETIEFDDYDLKDITVSGRCMRSLLKARNILPTAAGYDTYNTNIEDIMHGLVDKNAANPTKAGRKYPNLVMAASGHRGDTTSYQSTYGVLMDELTKLSELSQIGTRVILDYAGKKLRFETAIGVDRTYNNSGGNGWAIFSQKFSNVEKRVLTQSIADYRNMAYVAGQGEEADREVVLLGDELTGYDRREVYVDARDIGKDSDVTLADRGKAKLAEYPKVSSYQASVDPSGYKTSWDLGDFVSILDTELGIQQDQQIISVKEAWEKDGATLEVEFGSPLKTIYQAIKRDTAVQTATTKGPPGTDGKTPTFHVGEDGHLYATYN